MSQINKSKQSRHRPHYSVDIDMEQDSRPVTLDARSLTLPSVAVIAVVLSSIALTFGLAQERTRLDKRIDIVLASVQRLATSISSLADGLKYGTADRYTRTDHALWCARVTAANKGFRCPDDFPRTTTRESQSFGSTLDSVSREAGDVSEKSRDVPAGEKE